MIRDGILRKSGDSDTGGCVEVAALPGGGVQVRDTKDRDGGTHTYTPRVARLHRGHQARRV